MKIDIDQLSYDELVDLNHRVVQRLRFLDQARAHTQMLQFRIGERVIFEPEGRGPLYGVITKYNRKTVNVLTDEGQEWRVAPGHLRKAATEAARKTPEIRLLRSE